MNVQDSITALQGDRDAQSFAPRAFARRHRVDYRIRRVA
jgi:hypothetical protein